MSLQTKIETKLSEALKLKDKPTYSTLRLVVAAIKDSMIAKKIKVSSNDQCVRPVFAHFVNAETVSCHHFSFSRRDWKR